MPPVPATVAAKPPTPEPEIIASLIPPSTDLRKRDPGIPSVIPGRLGKDASSVDAFANSWEEGIFNVIPVGTPVIPGWWIPAGIPGTLRICPPVPGNENPPVAPGI